MNWGAQLVYGFLASAATVAGIVQTGFEKEDGATVDGWTRYLYTENKTGFRVVLFIMTVAVKNKKPIVVSATALREAGFKSGQELEVRVVGGAITILPKAPAADDEFTAAERRAIDRGIAQSEKEYHEGKIAGPFATAEEFLADLHAASAKLSPKRKPKRART